VKPTFDYLRLLCAVPFGALVVPSKHPPKSGHLP
jgi:hypothetical protein